MINNLITVMIIFLMGALKITLITILKIQLLLKKIMMSITQVHILNL